MGEILNAEFLSGSMKTDFQLDTLKNIIEDSLKELIPILCNRVIAKTPKNTSIDIKYERWRVLNAYGYIKEHCPCVKFGVSLFVFGNSHFKLVMV